MPPRRICYDKAMEQVSIPEQVASRAAVLIDVRRDDEWAAGHAAGALHFELARMERGELPAVPKDGTIYLYCQGGTRSAAAAEILQRNGFSRARNIGGVADWQALGGKMV